MQKAGEIGGCLNSKSIDLAARSGRDLVSTIGRTPLIELSHCSPAEGVRLFAKLEARNPSGSVKDRIARRMVTKAWEEGRLAAGRTAVVASTGNTGIAFAMMGRALGFATQVVMPTNVFAAIPKVLEAFGGAVEWVSAEEGMESAIRVAQNLALNNGWTLFDQFSDASNPLAHYETTAAEILEDLPHVDAFIAGFGTGGTLMGAGRRLKEANPATKVIAVEPHPGSVVQGLRSLSEGYVPPIMDLNLLDGKILVRGGDAFRATADLLRREAMFVGVSSGAVLHAARRAAHRIGQGNVVLMFADGGWKYLGRDSWNVTPEPENDEPLDDTMWW
jgi:cysteine synthase B